MWLVISATVCYWLWISFVGQKVIWSLGFSGGDTDPFGTGTIKIDGQIALCSPGNPQCFHRVQPFFYRAGWWSRSTVVMVARTILAAGRVAIFREIRVTVTAFCLLHSMIPWGVPIVLYRTRAARINSWYRGTRAARLGNEIGRNQVPRNTVVHALVHLGYK